MQGTDPDDAMVVLLHGLWMPGLEMTLLQHRLERHGLRCVRHSYPTFHGTVDDALEQLARRVAELPGQRVHFVAHSLGGLLLRYYFERWPEARPGRVVTLGTPHRGSRVARVIDRAGPLRWLLGNGRHMGLLGDAPAWNPTRELGVVAGTLNIGVGWLIPGLDLPNDGTVPVAETRCADLVDFLELPVSHMGLVLSNRVAEAVSLFLATARFDAPASEGSGLES